MEINKASMVIANIKQSWHNTLAMSKGFEYAWPTPTVTPQWK